MPYTIRIHRVINSSPEKIYKAFTDADAMAKWLPPDGFTAKVHSLEPVEGGTYRMSFTNFTTGNSHFFGGKFIELVPFELIRYTDKFEDPNMPEEMAVTVSLKKVSVGTDINITSEGLPDVIPEEACYLGWQQSLRNLEMLVEPDIPDDMG